MGGVLIRTEDPAPRAELAAQMGMTRKDLEIIFFAGRSGTMAQLGKINTQQHLENIRQELKLTLKAQYKTGLLSNAFSNLRDWIASEGKFSDAFDDMVISAEVGLMKPDPRIYQLALEQLEVSPSESIFIDDFQHNIDGAQSLGMHAIHFQNPDQVLGDIQRILLKG
jgi:epoxide hydrolase-like predicted phosphatase